MKLRTRTAGHFYWLITTLLAFLTWRCQANTLELDWTFQGFTAPFLTINAGDEVDIVNRDDTFDLRLTSGPAPENFHSDIPPTDTSVYYVPVVYDTPGIYTLSDEFGNSTMVTVNTGQPLSVAITSPTNNATFTAPATFAVTAEPSGGNMPYPEMQFFVGTNMIGDVFSEPFTSTVTNLPAGTYNINVVVFDNTFNTATNSIMVNVGPPPQPPQLTATRAGNQILVTWPTNNSDGFTLYTATTFGPDASWNLVSPPPTLLGNQWVVTNSISGPGQFFRLSSQ